MAKNEMSQEEYDEVIRQFEIMKANFYHEIEIFDIKKEGEDLQKRIGDGESAYDLRALISAFGKKAQKWLDYDEERKNRSEDWNYHNQDTWQVS